MLRLRLSLLTMRLKSDIKCRIFATVLGRSYFWELLLIRDLKLLTWPIENNNWKERS